MWLAKEGQHLNVSSGPPTGLDGGGMRGARQRRLPEWTVGVCLTVECFQYRMISGMFSTGCRRW